MSGFERSRDCDQDVCKLVIEGLQARSCLELDEHHRNPGTAGGEDEREQGRAEDEHREESDRDAAADTDVQKLGGAKRKVCALEQALEHAELPDVRERALGSGEEHLHELLAAA